MINPLNEVETRISTVRKMLSSIDESRDIVLCKSLAETADNLLFDLAEYTSEIREIMRVFGDGINEERLNVIAMMNAEICKFLSNGSNAYDNYKDNSNRYFLVNISYQDNIDMLRSVAARISKIAKYIVTINENGCTVRHTSEILEGSTKYPSFIVLNDENSKGASVKAVHKAIFLFCKWYNNENSKNISNGEGSPVGT